MHFIPPGHPLRAATANDPRASREFSLFVVRDGKRQAHRIKWFLVVFLVVRAMEVLDLLLTFQFNSRLESFIAKFKTADLSASGQQRGGRSLLVPLLVETFDPFDQSK